VRAREPDRVGHVERDGVRVLYEVHGEGEPTLLLLPTWSIIHSRHWKAQVPYLARHFRVVTFDGRGNGGSDRPKDPEAYREEEFAADALAVMDATGTERAILVSLSIGSDARAPPGREPPRAGERVSCSSDPSLAITPLLPERRAHSFSEPLETEDGWAKFNQHYWRRDYRGFLEFFFGRMFTEPHSTKQIEDCVGWGLETIPETLIASATGAGAGPGGAPGALRAGAVPGAGGPRRGGRDQPEHERASGWPREAGGSS
jgi:pimeloyl-ACP methyl ester carboxylesterase